jgi:DNA-binding transcriptional LysR family regulator
MDQPPQPPSPPPSPYKNIPTDLLRTLVTVVDLKGFTRAGERLARSQPAISLQIKRLQELLGTPLFDRETGGARLTERGQLVSNYARRILALNDEILARLATTDGAARFRIGLPESYAGLVMPKLMADDRARGARTGYDLVCDVSGALLERLNEEQLDVALAFTPDNPVARAALTWPEPLCWVGRPESVAASGPLPVLAMADPSVLRRVMVAGLAAGGHAYEIVMTGPNLPAMLAMARLGLGVTVAPRRLVDDPDAVLDGAGLPGMSDLIGGLYLGPGAQRAPAFGLAVRVGELLGVRNTTN